VDLNPTRSGDITRKLPFFISKAILKKRNNWVVSFYIRHFGLFGVHRIAERGSMYWELPYQGVYMKLRDISFAILVLVMTTLAYYFVRTLDFTLFCLIFFGICYLETETGILANSVRVGKLRLKEDRTPQLREYYELVKWWTPITLSLAFGLTSIVFALREIPGIRPLILLSLFMWAVSVITIGFTLFLVWIIREGAIAKHLLLNSAFTWLFTIITAAISGFIASFFGISFLEDISVSIFPILIYELFRLNFVRSAIFAVRFSSIDQAVMVLSLAEKEYVQGDPFLEKIESTKKKISTFLEKAIILTRQQSEILSYLSSKKYDLSAEIENEGLTLLPEIPAAHALKKEGEDLEIHGPFVLEDRTFFSTHYRCGGALMGFSVFELKSRSLVSDTESVKKIAVCDILLRRTKKHKESIKTKLHIYRTRLRFFLSDVLHKILTRQIINNLSNWLSKFEESERAKYEGLIGLDLTALLDYIITRSIFYIDLTLRRLGKKFLEVHNYQTACLTIECKKRELALYEEQLGVWKQRTEAAEIVPLKVLGTGYVRKSSERIKEEIALKCQQLEQWLVSLDDETQDMMNILRIASQNGFDDCSDQVFQ